MVRLPATVHRVLRTLTWTVTDFHKTPRRRAALALLLGGLVAYSLVFRLYQVNTTFWLFADQIRDWGLVGQPLAAMPGRGTPRVDHGYSFGPVFYYVLWTIRRTVGALCEALPHSGAYGLAALHALGEAVLLYGMLHLRMGLGMACVVALSLASAAPEAALSGTIWNPNLSVAFALGALGLLCMEAPRSRLGLGATLLCAMGALHCHTPTLFLAAPVGAAAYLGHGRGGSQRPWRVGAVIVLGTVAAAQLPY
ncbi:MAG: hypothetical protein EOO40_09400, partial [Deltaproteobacteria bacterium]